MEFGDREIWATFVGNPETGEVHPIETESKVTSYDGDGAQTIHRFRMKVRLACGCILKDGELPAVNCMVCAKPVCATHQHICQICLECVLCPTCSKPTEIDKQLKPLCPTCFQTFKFEQWITFWIRLPLLPFTLSYFLLRALGVVRVYTWIIPDAEPPAPQPQMMVETQWKEIGTQQTKQQPNR